MAAEPVGEKEANPRDLACSSDITFLVPVPHEIEVFCNVCLDLMLDPHLSSCCGHHFCLRCLRELQRRSSLCPMCKEPKFTAVLNKNLQRSIFNFRIYCPLKGNGCPWQGEVKGLKEHLLEREREGECPYVRVACANECGLMVERCRLKEHENEICPKKPVFDPMEVSRQLHKALSQTDTLSVQLNEAMQVSAGNVKRMATLEQQLSVALAEIRLLKSRIAVLEGSDRGLVASPVQAETSISVLSPGACMAISNPSMEPSLRVVPYEFAFGNYARRCENPELWFCRPFYSHPCGYKLCIRVAPQGLGTGEGSHVSIHTYLMRGEYDDTLRWPFRGDITIQLLNQLGDECHHEQTTSFNERTPNQYCDR